METAPDAIPFMSETLRETGAQKSLGTIDFSQEDLAMRNSIGGIGGSLLFCWVGGGFAGYQSTRPLLALLGKRDVNPTAFRFMRWGTFLVGATVFSELGSKLLGDAHLDKLLASQTTLGVWARAKLQQEYPNSALAQKYRDMIQRDEEESQLPSLRRTHFSRSADSVSPPPQRQPWDAGAQRQSRRDTNNNNNSEYSSRPVFASKQPAGRQSEPEEMFIADDNSDDYDDGRSLRSVGGRASRWEDDRQQQQQQLKSTARWADDGETSPSPARSSSSSTIGNSLAERDMRRKLRVQSERW